MSLGPVLDPAERVSLNRRRRRVLRLLASFVSLPLLLLLVAWTSEQFGEELPADASYRWSGTATVYVRAKVVTECQLTPSQPDDVLIIHPDKSAFAMDGVDVRGSSSAETTLKCDAPVTISSGMTRIATYPARFTSLLLLVWPLLGLWTAIEALMLMRRRLRVGDLRLGR